LEPVRKDVAGDCRKWHNVGFIIIVAVCNSSDDVKEVEIVSSCGSMRQTRNACRVLVGRPERKIHLKDDIKMDFKGIGRESMF
jgi:hypothetical protein